MQKFFLYARKSTDVEDKQVLSIEAQLTELRAYAQKEGLWISETIIEKKTAKIPGRPLFNAMLNRIEEGEAAGIISWHPDRLARNSVDGGKIIYLLDIGKLQTLKFPQFWYENTAQGKFMLNMAFGQSKYYVDSLSENTKRGQRQKMRRGEYPGHVPVGYINDTRTKTVAVDKRKAPVIRQAYELYAEGKSRLEDISRFFAEHGLRSARGNRYSRDRIAHILSNPFYYGHFKYSGELHEGVHQPIVSKKIFDAVQTVLAERGKVRQKPKNDPQAFCGLIRCGVCGLMITAENKIKRQKNGNQHHYVYYRCSRRSKTIKCLGPFIRHEKLDGQLSSLIQKFSLPEDWARQLLSMLEKDEKENTRSAEIFVQAAREKIQMISNKLQRLLDGYLEQDIEQTIYRTEKAKLMSEKKTIEEQILAFEHQKTGWFEPMRQWIKDAEISRKNIIQTDVTQKKVIAKKMFGLNLQLTGQQLQLPPINDEFVFQLPQLINNQPIELPPTQIDVTGQLPPKINEQKTAWDYLRQTIEKREKIDNCLLIVHLYNQVRTYFQSGAP